MFDKFPLSDLAKRLTDAVPVDFSILRDDLEKNFQAVLQASFAKMNLVSREEFDVQQAVLARTRERLAALEARIEGLERQIESR